MNSAWKMIGGTILAAVAVGTAINIKAIRRYIRMGMM
jgi:hypothetical protein